MKTRNKIIIFTLILAMLLPLLFSSSSILIKDSSGDTINNDIINSPTTPDLDLTTTSVEESIEKYGELNVAGYGRELLLLDTKNPEIFNFTEFPNNTVLWTDMGSKAEYDNLTFDAMYSKNISLFPSTLTPLFIIGFIEQYEIFTATSNLTDMFYGGGGFNDTDLDAILENPELLTSMIGNVYMDFNIKRHDECFTSFGYHHNWGCILFSVSYSGIRDEVQVGQYPIFITPIVFDVKGYLSWQEAMFPKLQILWINLFYVTQPIILSEWGEVDEMEVHLNAYDIWESQVFDMGLSADPTPALSLFSGWGNYGWYNPHMREYMIDNGTRMTYSMTNLTMYSKPMDAIPLGEMNLAENITSTYNYTVIDDDNTHHKGNYDERWIDTNIKEFIYFKAEEVSKIGMENSSYTTVFDEHAKNMTITTSSNITLNYTIEPSNGTIIANFSEYFIGIGGLGGSNISFTIVLDYRINISITRWDYIQDFDNVSTDVFNTTSYLHHNFILNFSVPTSSDKVNISVIYEYKNDIPSYVNMSCLIDGVEAPRGDDYIFGFNNTAFYIDSSFDIHIPIPSVQENESKIVYDSPVHTTALETEHVNGYIIDDTVNVKSCLIEFEYSMNASTFETDVIMLIDLPNKSMFYAHQLFVDNVSHPFTITQNDDVNFTVSFKNVAIKLVARIDISITMDNQITERIWLSDNSIEINIRQRNYKLDIVGYYGDWLIIKDINIIEEGFSESSVTYLAAIIGQMSYTTISGDLNLILDTLSPNTTEEIICRYYTYSYLDVTVRDENGNPVRNIPVALYVGDVRLFIGITDFAGRIVFFDLYAESYRIEVYYQGEKIVDETFNLTINEQKTISYQTALPPITMTLIYVIIGVVVAIGIGVGVGLYLWRRRSNKKAEKQGKLKSKMFSNKTVTFEW